MDFFNSLFRYFTSEPIDSEVSQQQKAATKKIIPSSGVKKAAEDIVVNNDQPFLSDIRALVDYFGPLYQGMVIETDLQEMLSLCPRQRRRSDAYNSLVNYLGREHGVTLMIKKKYGTERTTN